jgi:hypothetical protein
MAIKNTKATKATAKKTTTKKGAKAKAPSKKNAPGRSAPVEAKAGSKLARDLATLAKLGKTQLWQRYEEVFGRKTRSCNTNHLRSAIAQQLQSGGAKATKPPVNGTARIAAASASGERDPRLPKNGTVLEREHKGTTHRVKVVEDGFEYKGEKHRSLSGLAKLITGQIWNGWVWFGLVQRPEAKKGAAHAS